MDRNFARSLALVLKSEGGFVNNPKDPGGPTNKGITIATYRRYVSAKATVDDLKRISDADVAKVYRKQYWDAVKGDDLPDGVDYATMDFAVNSGPSRSAKYLQAAVGVPQDGSIGPATIAAAKAKPAGVVIDTLCDARLAFLKRLPTWTTFGKGWTSRVASVRANALKMTAQPQAAPPAPAAPIPEPQTPVLVPAAPERAPQPLPKPPSKLAPAATVLAILAMALAGFWHRITELFWSIF